MHECAGHKRIIAYFLLDPFRRDNEDFVLVRSQEPEARSQNVDRVAEEVGENSRPIQAGMPRERFLASDSWLLPCRYKQLPHHFDVASEFRDLKRSRGSSLGVPIDAGEKGTDP
jgi:hypothetical protein